MFHPSRNVRQEIRDVTLVGKGKLWKRAVEGCIVGVEVKLKVVGFGDVTQGKCVERKGSQRDLSGRGVS